MNAERAWKQWVIAITAGDHEELADASVTTAWRRLQPNDPVSWIQLSHFGHAGASGLHVLALVALGRLWLQKRLYRLYVIVQRMDFERAFIRPQRFNRGPSRVE
jgi:hypothetical protein